MIDRVTVFGLAASAAGLLFVLELVRRRKLREDYSLLWLATAVVLIVLSASRSLLDRFAEILGVVTYPPAALFLVAIMFMLFILLHYATVLSRLTKESKEVAQQVAILRWELSQARKALAAYQAGRDDEQHEQRGDVER